MRFLGKIFSKNRISSKSKEISIGTPDFDSKTIQPADRKAPSIELFIDVALKHLLDLPDSKNAVTFLIPGTNNRAYIRLLPLEDPSKDNWVYQVGAFREGTDLLSSSFLKHGAREQLISYIYSAEGRSKAAQAVICNSNSIDKKW